MLEITQTRAKIADMSQMLHTCLLIFVGFLKSGVFYVLLKGWAVKLNCEIPFPSFSLVPQIFPRTLPTVTVQLDQDHLGLPAGFSYTLVLMVLTAAHWSGADFALI